MNNNIFLQTQSKESDLSDSSILLSPEESQTAGSASKPTTFSSLFSLSSDLNSFMFPQKVEYLPLGELKKDYCSEEFNCEIEESFQFTENFSSQLNNQAAESNDCCHDLPKLETLNPRSRKLSTITTDSETSEQYYSCLLYTSPSPRDLSTSRMPSSA
eukprot:TRINITY_DN1605_c0_g1_i3.p1 TRINITY_DN1605_c0_g1~~TRINITY_DN1605_c0_g1_i3.p1  ORF type:complete len:158 (-),score=53.20 TRINITY_DN1605_c0_g1_i3:11-484(-)